MSNPPRSTVDETAANRYAVVGNPIAHSRSPEIHLAFAAQFGMHIRYDRALVEPGEFARFADEFAAAGGAGLNITVPFKGDAYAYATRLDGAARAAEAVNTLVFADDQPPAGYNTDGIGLCVDLQRRHGVALEGCSILLLGAGGAASGVVQPLLAARPAKLVVANRTVARAERLVAHHSDLATGAPPLSACGLTDLHTAFDVVINATSSGLEGDAAPIAPEVVAGAFCYDMSYGNAALFARWAAQHGAAASVDGLGMLVEQAAQSFYLWHGLRPHTDAVVEQLRQQL